jgi:hypothetical protein
VQLAGADIRAQHCTIAVKGDSFTSVFLFTPRQPCNCLVSSLNAIIHHIYARNRSLSANSVVPHGDAVVVVSGKRLQSGEARPLVTHDRVVLGASHVFRFVVPGQQPVRWVDWLFCSLPALRNMGGECSENRKGRTYMREKRGWGVGLFGGWGVCFVLFCCRLETPLSFYRGEVAAVF